MKYLNSLLAGVVFLHALITAPLQVECISADGQYLLEILGQDPCHASVVNLPQTACARGTADVRATLVRGDPCMDVILDSQEGVQTCDDSLIPQLQAPGSLIPLQDAEREIVLETNHLESAFRFLRLRGSEPSIRLTLRI